MPINLLYFIVFIEGFSSLGSEIIALRRLVPHIGSSIIVTAPTIGFFLLALALGYSSGAKVADRFSEVVTRNFLISALIVGIGLSRTFVDTLFTVPTLLSYLTFISLVLCPIAWLLGQTVPILTNLMKHERTGESSGYALYWSTLGSFLGAVSLSLFVMQYFGVSAAVVICSLALTIGSIFIGKNKLQITTWLKTLGICAIVSIVNLYPSHNVIDTAYADYSIKTIPRDKDDINPKTFVINNSYASKIEDSNPTNYDKYIKKIRGIILDELNFKSKDILVLGAGGFMLSHKETTNKYTYVDIEPAIKEIAEKQFLKEPINGTFISDDARRYIHSNQNKYDAVVIDTYSSHTSIPSHLITQEFWKDIRKSLNPQGILIANLILDSRLQRPYSRNILATIESVYGRCSVEALHKDKPMSNVIVMCYQTSYPTMDFPYTDERNNADFHQAF
jgi:predicted membrane-bound spermidine synthase